MAEASTPMCRSAASEAFLVGKKTSLAPPSHVWDAEEKKQIGGVQCTAGTCNPAWIEPALWLDRVEGAAATAAVG